MDFIKKIHLGIQSLIHWALLKLLYKIGQPCMRLILLEENFMLN